MSNWSKVGSKIKVEASAFEQNLGGGAFFNPGKHNDVFIAEIERTESRASGNPMVVVTFENNAGATIKKWVNILQKDKESGELILSTNYREFGAALLGLSSHYPDNQELRNDFFNGHLLDNVELFDKFVGLRASIVVASGEEGYKIEVSGDSKVITDVETGQPFEGTTAYDDYDSAKAKAKEMGLMPCYNNVSKVIEPTAEFMELNVKAITGLLKGKKVLKTAPSI